VWNAALPNSSFSILPKPEDLLGRWVANRYLITECLEQTSSSSSYRAHHDAIDRSVLLRVLPARPGLTRESCRRALAGAERVSMLPSPHLTRTLDVGLVAGRFPFVVSEYSKGRTLEAVLDSSGPLEIQRLMPIARQLASVLQITHRAGVVHGSIGVDKLWLESLEHRPEWVRIMGFGLSELSRSELDMPESGVFMSSARGTGGLTRMSSSVAMRADVRALGATLFALADGSRGAVQSQPSPGATDSDFADTTWTGQRAVVRGFAMIVRRSLSLLPEGNFTSMDQVLHALERLEQTARSISPGAARPGQAVTAVHTPVRRARGVVLGEPKVIVREG
jgi:serine/threonine protein kinase